MARSPIGRFRDDAARRRYMAAYDDALAAWPAPPNEVDIETRFGSTHVLVTGAAEGTPIVLLHAVAVASPSWYPNVAALAADHPVYAVDTIGDVGRSTQTVSVRTGDDMAQWLDDVLGALNLPRVHLVGLSYGGWVALNQARRSPGCLASVTAVDPVGSIGRGKATFLPRIAPDAFLASVFKSDPALHRLLRVLNNGAMPEAPLLELSIAGLRTFRGKQPMPKRMGDEDLRAIVSPVLLLFGGRSPVNRAHKAALRSRDLIPNAIADVLPDVGHMIPVQQPAEFADRVLDFVNRLDDADR
jgi:pimeloyl-ACP methyl ester carboxylesterase